MNCLDNFKKWQSQSILFAWMVCIIAACFYSYDIFIRVAPSVMMSGLEKDFHIGASSLGFLSAAYFYAYIIFQLPAGIIIDKFNVRWVISTAMLLCILGNLLFSVANSFEMAFLGRVLMGIGSAFGFIGAAKVASIWLPNRLFSPFISITVFIGTMGGLVADTALSALTHNLGWRLGNNVFTLVGIIILLLMVAFIKNKSNTSQQAIEKHHSSSLKAQLIMLLGLFRSFKFWVNAIIGAVLFVPINVLASLWGVGFIQAKMNISSTVAADVNSLLFLGSAIGCIAIAIISAYTNNFRRLIIISSVLLTVFSIIVIYVALPMWLFVTIYFLLGFSVGAQTLSFGIGKFFAPQEATATAVSAVNMINNLVGSILLPLFGLILAVVANHHVAGQAYSLHSYYFAMLMVPLLTLLCIPLCYYIPKEIE
ncbi:MFS transporter [Francisellaceae bacterium]|nr:MFS transporter [Francisellaceae bacterium]